jgi:predicted nuclease with TOPRIM domain
MADRVKPIEEMEKPELIEELKAREAEVETLAVRLDDLTQERERLTNTVQQKVTELATVQEQLAVVTRDSKPKRWAVYERCSV